MTSIVPTNVPLIMTTAGPQPTSPATLNQTLIEGVAAINPGYTVLPGGLIEDLSSTATGALVNMDQSRVDAVASVTPYGANAYILSQQGFMLGIPQGQTTNTSVFVVFSSSSIGYVIPKGFVVSDGTYQYVLQEGGVIESGGSSAQLFAVANQPGSWAVNAGTVTQIITSIPSGYTITVTNPQAGTPGSAAETVQSYRARVLQANQVAGQATPNYILTLLQAISGVTPRLTAVLQSTFGWEIICGGGDPYAVANAIYLGTLDLSTIVGSATSARNVNVTLTDFPNQYTVTFVNPPQQVVTLQAIWNTNLPNFTAGAQVNQLGSTAIQNYINSIRVGEPINLNAMSAAFETAIASVLPIENLSTLTYTVSINAIVTPPEAGTELILGDPESYFYISASGATVTQG